MSLSLFKYQFCVLRVFMVTSFILHLINVGQAVTESVFFLFFCFFFTVHNFCILAIQNTNSIPL